MDLKLVFLHIILICDLYAFCILNRNACATDRERSFVFEVFLNLSMLRPRTQFCF